MYKQLGEITVILDIVHIVDERISLRIECKGTVESRPNCFTRLFIHSFILPITIKKINKVILFYLLRSAFNLFAASVKLR